MAEYTSIRIRKDLNEKMQIIKKQNNYKSINELLDKTLDKTVNEELGVIYEHELFHIGDKQITWTDLKDATTGTNWSHGNDKITILFKDNQGAFIRFNINDEVYCEYYHFI